MQFHKALTTSLALTFAAPLAQALAADADAGKNVYEKSCAGCHGADGKGNEKMAKLPGFEKGLNIVTKETKAKSDAELLKIIVEGAGKMPPSKKLTVDEHKAALRYSRSLAK